MLNVALTGNIAAGKSTVVDLFHRWGATIIDADALAREAQTPGGDVLAAIAGRFGADVPCVRRDPRPAALRGKVMGDQAALDALNQIVHPAVRRRRDELLREPVRRATCSSSTTSPCCSRRSTRPVRCRGPGGPSAALRRTRLRTMRGLSNDEADRMIARRCPRSASGGQSDFVIEKRAVAQAASSVKPAPCSTTCATARRWPRWRATARSLLLAAAEAPTNWRSTPSRTATRTQGCRSGGSRGTRRRSRKRWAAVGGRRTPSSRPPPPRRRRSRHGCAPAVRACSPPSSDDPDPVAVRLISGPGRRPAVVERDGRGEGYPGHRSTVKATGCNWNRSIVAPARRAALQEQPAGAPGPEIQAHRDGVGVVGEGCEHAGRPAAAMLLRRRRGGGGPRRWRPAAADGRPALSRSPPRPP